MTEDRVSKFSLAIPIFVVALIMGVALFKTFYPGINIVSGEIEGFNEAVCPLGESIDLRPEARIIPGYHLVYSGRVSIDSVDYYLVTIKHQPSGRAMEAYTLWLEMGQEFVVYKFTLKLESGDESEIYVIRVL